MVEQLARFLGVSCDKAQLESLTEHCHQLVDQCCNAEALPVGRGMRPCPSLPPSSASAQGPVPSLPVSVVPHIRVLPCVSFLQSTLLCGRPEGLLEAGPVHSPAAVS